MKLKNLFRTANPTLKELIKTGNLQGIKNIAVNTLKVELMKPFQSKNTSLNPIHYAVRCKQNDIIEYFLYVMPELWKQTDPNGKQPLVWAIETQNWELTKYFTAIFSSEVTFYLTLALYKEDYAEVIRLVSTIEDKSILTPLITSGKEALELMILDPSLAQIFLESDSIKTMISKVRGCLVTENTVELYKTAGKRNSFYAVIDRKKHKTSKYEVGDRIGKGSHGLVRRLKTADQQQIIVKSNVNEVILEPGEKPTDLTDDLQRELYFNNILYKDSVPARAFEFYYPIEDSDQILYENRLVRPYVEGDTVYDLVKDIKSDLKLAKLILKIIRELMRAHGAGVVIGDLNPRNIIANEALGTFIIRFIDLGLSYGINEKSAHLWNDPDILFDEKGDPVDKAWFPPEVWGEDKKSVKPDTSQNVFSIAYSIVLLLKRATHLDIDAFCKNFPSIENFIQTGLNDDPKLRPKLENFYIELSKEIKNHVAMEVALANANDQTDSYDDDNNSSLQNSNQIAGGINFFNTPTNNNKSTSKTSSSSVQYSP